MFEKIIKESLLRIIPSLGFDEIEINLEHPAEEINGDYSSNIALALFSKVDKEKYKSPRDLALEILNKLKEDDQITGFCEKVEIAGPGFLNFYLKDEILVKKVFDGNFINKKESNNKKIIIEFTDPNPFKLFHIGHLYSNSVGESLARIFDFEGWEVRRANYQGDVGMHVAKTIWGVLEKLRIENYELGKIEEKELNERIKFLGEAYAMGSSEYKEDKNGKVKKEIAEINYLVYVSAQKMLEENEGWEKQVDYEKFLENGEHKYSLEEVKNIYEKGRKWSLEYFENIYKKLGTKFDHYFFESKTGEYGIKIVREFLEKGIFEKSDGAVVYKGEKDGLHTRVFVNSLGLPTYEAKDLGLVPLKYETFAYDKSVIVTANEIDEYFKVILKVLEKINPELAKKTIHISHGVVKLPEGKMSSRTGKVITGDVLLEDIKERILKMMGEDNDKFGDKEINEISEKLSVAAIKYAFLKNSVGGDIVFDFDKSLSLSGNSGPYIEYTYARSKSVLRKLETKNRKQDKKKEIWSYELNEEERSILRYIYRFDEIVFKALINFNPGEICNFVFELCQRFNSFYNKHKIVGDKDQEFRLKLTEVVSNVISQSLDLLGIETVERM